MTDEIHEPEEHHNPPPPPPPDEPVVVEEPVVDEKAAATKEVGQAITLLSTHSAAVIAGSTIGESLLLLKGAYARLTK